MLTLIDIIIAPFQQIVTKIFAFEVTHDLTIGGIALVAAVFGAIVSIISRSSVTLTSVGKEFKSKPKHNKIGFEVSKND